MLKVQVHEPESTPHLVALGNLGFKFVAKRQCWEREFWHRGDAECMVTDLKKLLRGIQEPTIKY